MALIAMSRHAYWLINYFKKRDGEYIYILSETNLESLNGVRIFNTIEEAIEILAQYYYEI